jgi:CBS-domain-containing membrane protein
MRVTWPGTITALVGSRIDADELNPSPQAQEPNMQVAAELMTADPAVIRASDRVSDAVQLFQALDVRHLPVIDDHRRLIGMLSDRDLRSLALPQLVDSEWVGTIQTALDASVSTLMNGDVVCVDAETGADEIAELLVENKIGAVPVIDADNRLIGIVSYVDLIRPIASGTSVTN